MTLAAWQMVQATIGARRYFKLLPQLCGEVFGPGLQGLEAGLRLRQQAGGTLVRGDQLVERSRAVGEPPDRVLEARQQLLEGGLGLGVQLTDAATRPRMPFTKRPASSPENVFASSIDSLIAALVGTRLSIVIS